MNPIEQLALAALQRASEANGDGGRISQKASQRASSEEQPEIKARVALRKERNRQSAASSRKRAKLRTEELEEENCKLRMENERLRRLLSSGYLVEGGAVPDQVLETGFSSELTHGDEGEDSDGQGATTSSSPPRTPSVSEETCVLSTPRGNADGWSASPM